MVEQQTYAAISELNSSLRAGLFVAPRRVKPSASKADAIAAKEAQRERQRGQSRCAVVVFSDVKLETLKMNCRSTDEVHQFGKFTALILDGVSIRDSIKILGQSRLYGLKTHSIREYVKRPSLEQLHKEVSRLDD